MIEPFLEESTALRAMFPPIFSSECSLFPIFDEFVIKFNQIFRRFWSAFAFSQTTIIRANWKLVGISCATEIIAALSCWSTKRTSIQKYSFPNNWTQTFRNEFWLLFDPKTFLSTHGRLPFCTSPYMRNCEVFGPKISIVFHRWTHTSPFEERQGPSRMAFEWEWCDWKVCFKHNSNLKY